jgi:hypothetical protein
MPRTSAFWSQKPLIARYYQERGGPQERLVAYHLFWRGENFYTKNEIHQGPLEERTVFDFWQDTDSRLRDWLARRRGQRHFLLFEATREATVRRLLPAGAENALRILDRRHGLFVLAEVRL